MDCEEVGIAGLGLIGVSIAQGLAGGFAKTIIGFDPDRRARSAAASYLTATTARFDDLKGTDLVIIAAPPVQVSVLVRQMADWGDCNTIGTDVCSVKQVVADTVPESLRPRFVPGHPMAGLETTGSSMARADLFHGAFWVMCPFDQTDNTSVQLVRSMVRHLRALPVMIDPIEHDQHMALLSHVPHVLAATLLLRSEQFDQRNIHGKSWDDLTRVGGSNPKLWADILLANRQCVLEELDATCEKIAQFRSAIETSDAPELERLIGRARELK